MEDDSSVESSWAMEWTGYASSQEALQAGAIRLTDLTRSRRGAKLDARLTPAGGQRAQPRYLVVVARAATELYASLKRGHSRTATASRSSEIAASASAANATMLWGSIAAEATAALGSMSTGTSGGVNGRGCLALAFLRHFRRTSRERLDLSNLLIGAVRDGSDRPWSAIHSVPARDQYVLPAGSPRIDRRRATIRSAPPRSQ